MREDLCSDDGWSLTAKEQETSGKVNRCCLTMKVIRRYLPQLVFIVAATLILTAVFLNTNKDRDKFITKFEALSPKLNVDIHLKPVLLYNATTEHNLQAEVNIPADAKCKPKRSVVFIKTHKSGSTTLIATLQKYAYLNNLLMMVPNIEHNMFDWPLQFRPNKANVKAENNSKFDMLVNHIIFNKTLIAPLMKPEAQYVTILREPLAHLRSAFQYFDLNRNNRLGTGVDAMKMFLSNPHKYDKSPEWMQKILPLATNRINSMTRNLQSADLGLSYWDFDKQAVVQKFVNQTMKSFDFIVLLERLDESMVLLRRHMCWRMQDVIFISKNVNPDRLFEMRDLPEPSRMNAYKWNNVDLLLYQAANKRIDDLKRKEEGIQDEINAYKLIQLQISKHCFGVLYHKSATGNLTIPAGQWNEEIIVDNTFCVLLLLDERDLTHVFKCKQYPYRRDCQNKFGARVNTMVSMIEGKEAYRNIQMTPRTP